MSAGEVVPPILTELELLTALGVVRFSDDDEAATHQIAASHEVLRARVEELERLQADWEALDELTALRALRAENLRLRAENETFRNRGDVLHARFKEQFDAREEAEAENLRLRKQYDDLNAVATAALDAWKTRAEAAEAENLRLRETLTALLDMTRLDDRRASAVEARARAVLAGETHPTM